VKEVAEGKKKPSSKIKEGGGGDKGLKKRAAGFRVGAETRTYKGFLSKKKSEK